MKTKKSRSALGETSVRKNPMGELVMESLRIELTEEETSYKGKVAGDQSWELSKLKAEIKAIKSDFKGRIDTLQSDLDANLACIKEGFEERETECTKVMNKNSDTVEFWVDGVMVKDRPANDLDRQKAIPFLRKQKEESEAQQFNGIVVDHKKKASGDES